MNKGNDTPLISCLCLTENRPEFLKRAVHYFLNQTYSRKELIVAYPTVDLATRQVLQEIQSPHIIHLTFDNPREISLGKKRNMAVDKCNGEYFCVWDDDDWHHPERLARQHQFLKESNSKSSVLSRVLLYDDISQKGYLSGKRKAWENTLLCEKSLTRLPAFRYADLPLGEDSVFLSALLEHHLIAALDQPELYIYFHHGTNTCARSHWLKNIVGWGSELHHEDSSCMKTILKNPSAYLDAIKSLPEILSRQKS